MGTDGVGSQNISSTTFSSAMYETILFTARSIKAPLAASYHGVVKYDRGMRRDFRPCEPDRVPPSVSIDTPGTPNLRDCTLCGPGVIQPLVVWAARS